MTSLRQTIERIRQRENFPPRGDVSFRQLLKHFSLTPALSVRALIASDLIAQRYELDGRSAGLIGIPMGKVRLTSFGALQPFSGGDMVLRGGKVEPVVRYVAEVRFLGFHCREESGHDQGTTDDEPYFIIGISGIKANATKLFGPFKDVDSGENRFTTADEDVVRTDAQLPFTISVVAMEEDQGTSAEATETVKKALDEALNVTQAVAVALGQAVVVAATIALDTLLNHIGGFVSKAATAVLGLEDDFVGSNNARLGDWNDGDDNWHTIPRIIEPEPFGQSPYNLKLDVGDGEEGKYTLYFNVNVREVTERPV